MTELAILVPVKGRPHRVEPLLESIEAATSGVRVVFICDPGDHAEIAAVQAQGAECMVYEGNYAAKINAGARGTEEPLIFLGADDLHFHPGWFEKASALIRGKIQVIGTNDLCNPRVMAGNHSTHSLVARSYVEQGTIDEPGVLLHEGYEHEFVDDEFVQTAIKRGAFHFAADAIVEHLHPMVGKAPVDALYAEIPRRLRAGRKLYRRRRKLWT